MPTYKGSRLAATGKFAVTDIRVSQSSWVKSNDSIDAILL
jgi:hypothetical protein